VPFKKGKTGAKLAFKNSLNQDIYEMVVALKQKRTKVAYL